MIESTRVRYSGEVQSTNLNKYSQLHISDNLRSTRKNSSPLRAFWHEVDNDAVISMNQVKQLQKKLVRFQESLQVFTIPTRTESATYRASLIHEDSNIVRHISSNRSVRFSESLQVFLIPQRNEVHC